MKSWKMNADYEVELFTGRSGQQIINHSLEFLLFFLEERPVYTTKKYSNDYLDYVENVTGLRPKLVSDGLFENYWGRLDNIERERWWNSKLTTTQFQLEKGWDTKTKIITEKFNVSELDPHIDYLIKDPHGMSGQNFLTISRNLSENEKEIKIHQARKAGVLIAEPLLERVYDFSHYIYPTGTQIIYQNKVDGKFQYKGSLFANIHSPLQENLDFFNEISKKEWDKLEQQKTELLSYLSQYPNEAGFSIDSIVYRDHHELKIRSISEINYRRTMGRIAFELGKKYSKEYSRVEFYLMKTSNKLGPLWKSLKDRAECLVLSPGDTRFEMLLIFSNSVEEGMDRYCELVTNS